MITKHLTGHIFRAPSWFNAVRYSRRGSVRRQTRARRMTAATLSCPAEVLEARILPAAFIDLGPGEGLAVSDDGTTVVGNGPGAFRWTAEAGMVNPGFHFAFDVSASGSVIAGSHAGEAIRWTPETGVVGLGDLPGGSFSSRAEGVSADGSVLVGYGTTTDSREAFRWSTDSGMVGLGFLPGGAFSWATAVSADGAVVSGFSGNGTGDEAFRWTAETGMVGLGDLPGSAFASRALGQSADGSTIVGFSRSEAGPFGEAFRWTAGTGMAGLGFLPGGDFSEAWAASGDGSLVGGYSNTDDGRAPFLWDMNHGMRRLSDVLTTDYGIDLSAWQPGLAFGNVIDISADGRFLTGYAYTADWELRAWLAELDAPAPPPEVPVDVIVEISTTQEFLDSLIAIEGSLIMIDVD
ncbi:MAG TPA: hypothetical protein VML55_13940, partial [Planctomycetaceae bacterium]|nr:hypothetical protein [Planctomycetaceae bacterium]